MSHLPAERRARRTARTPPAHLETQRSVSFSVRSSDGSEVWWRWRGGETEERREDGIYWGWLVGGVWTCGITSVCSGTKILPLENGDGSRKRLNSFSYGSGIGDDADFDVCTSNSSRSNFQHAQTPRLLTYSCLFNLSCVSRGHLTSVAGNSRPREPESCRFQTCAWSITADLNG